MFEKLIIILFGVENDDTELQIDEYFSKYADAYSEDGKRNSNENTNDVYVDEYFIDKESGQELTEWSDLTDDEDSDPFVLKMRNIQTFKKALDLFPRLKKALTFKK